MDLLVPSKSIRIRGFGFMYNVNNNLNGFCPFERFAVPVPVFNIVLYRLY